MQIKKLLPTEPWIAQIYLSSNTVMINWRSVMYPRRPIARITRPHRHWWWSRRSRPQGREELDATMPWRLGATMPVRRHRRTDIVPHVQYPIVLAHVRRTMTPFGSSPAEQQKKKCLDWNPIAWWRPVWGESSNSLAWLQMWELSQKERGIEVVHRGEERRAI
jgi:hypothetical protein